MNVKTDKTIAIAMQDVQTRSDHLHVLAKMDIVEMALHVKVSR